jgi:levanbiose-producing levanase
MLALVQASSYGSDGTKSPDKWILFVGGDGTIKGFTDGTYYWVGDFDGFAFLPTYPDGQWLDGGADFYAAVVWTDPQAAIPLASAFFIAWMNNWAYANQLQPTAGYRGQLRIVRRIRLQLVEGLQRLMSTPLPAQNSIFTGMVAGTDQTIAEGTDYAWPAGAGVVASRIDLTLNRVGSAWPSGLWLSVKGERDSSRSSGSTSAETRPLSNEIRANRTYLAAMRGGRTVA